MTWIQTYKGRKFFPLDPRPEDIDIRDISHSLSLLCRFNGHSVVFYSVAEHSVLVSKAVAEEHALWGLLHDASEAYISDIPRPIKEKMPEFIEIEERIQRAVAERFGLSWPMPEEVKLTDTRALVTEMESLMSEPPEPWNLGVKPLEMKVEVMNSKDADMAFMHRFMELVE